jgi:hypothetical protein
MHSADASTHANIGQFIAALRDAYAAATITGTIAATSVFGREANSQL